MVATYIGVVLYIILFLGYMIYERFYEGKTTHFVPSSKVDLASKAVWEHGQGDLIRARDREESKKRKPSMTSALIMVLTPSFLKSNVDLNH